MILIKYEREGEGITLVLFCLQMLLILLSVVENNGIVDEKDFARRLRDWMLKGFPELGDPGEY